jgi:hypothetical protein
MRKDVAAADRCAAVRDAARNWTHAGLIDAAEAAHFTQAYPDDRRRLTPVLRSLAFVFTLLAVLAGFLLLVLVTGSPGDHAAQALALPVGVALLAVTEFLTGSQRLREAGVESATGLAGSGLLVVAAAWFADRVLSLGSTETTCFVCLVAAVVFAFGAWRWGSTVSAAFAVVCLGICLLELPAARVTWAVGALVLVPLAMRGSESPALCPSHRRACVAVLLVALVGLYVALHLGSWDGALLEHGALSHRSSPVRGLFVGTTALVPVGVVAVGAGTRRRMLLDLGLAFGVASLVTLRYYVHIAPLWAVLTASGSVLLLGGLALRRWLDRGGGRERGGYTAQPLSAAAETSRVVEAAVAVGVTPAHASPAEPRFAGKGGAAGGGGAGGSY